MATTDPTLAGKLKIDLRDLEGPIFWYIKFNIVLDPSSISQKTAKVTEVDGYILETQISYDLERNLIVITPVDQYEEGVFYILTISGKVRSAGGNNLRRDIHILFKIKDKRIDEYKMLPKGTIVAKPRKKPEKLKVQTSARVYSFTPEQKEKVDAAAKKGSLPYDRFGINIALAVLALPVALIGLAVQYQIAVIIGGAMILAGAVHIAVQLRSKKRRSLIQYNMGVMFFNAGFYKRAKKFLFKAAELDPMNEMAEMAVNKSTFYE